MSAGPYLLKQTHIDQFAGLSGDDNPIHIDPAFARSTAFGTPVAHGMLLMGLVFRELARLSDSAPVSSYQVMFPAAVPAGTGILISVAPMAENEYSFFVRREDDNVVVAQGQIRTERGAG